MAKNNFLLLLTFIGAGEYILALPSIRILKKNFPDKEFTAILRADSRFLDLVQSTKEIDEVITIDHRKTPLARQAGICLGLRKKNIGTALIYNPGSRFVIYSMLAGAKTRIGFDDKRGLTHCIIPPPDTYRVKYFNMLLEPLGIKVPPYEECLPMIRPDIPDAVQSEVDAAFVERYSGAEKPIVGICPGSSEEKRRWPKEKFGEIIAQIQRERGGSTMIFSGPGEEQLANSVKDAAVVSGADAGNIFISSHNTLISMMTTIGKCELFITNDTGPMHLATAMEVPIVDISKPDIPPMFGPVYPGSIAIINTSEICTGDRSNDLMRKIPVSIVFESAIRLLNGERPRGEIISIQT
jgi:heptosyltransferase II